MRVDNGTRQLVSGGWMYWPNGRPHDWRDQLPSHPPASTEPVVDPELANHAYHALLARCPLTAAHRADLHRRGFSDRQIERSLYASWPADSVEQARIVADVVAEHGDEFIGRVPGFFRRSGLPAFACSPGILQPVRRGERVERLKVRVDDVAKGEGGKYRWCSSNGKTAGMRCPAIAHVAMPSTAGDVWPRVGITEGNFKADAVADRLGFPCISVPAIGSTTGQVEILRQLGATEVVMLFDADRLTNPHVTRAEQRTVDHLAAGGFTTLRGSWPAMHKGIDDALAAGLLPVLEIAAPTDPDGPPDDDPAEVKRLREDLREARATISGMVQTLLNPHMPQSEKLALISAINIAEQKRQKGQVRGDGLVELTAAEIADDWRKEPSQPGESRAATNPDGSKPRMSRQQVGPLMQTLRDRGFISATPRSTIRARSNQSTYRDRVWDVVLPGKVSEVLAEAAKWQPDQPKQRKPRSTDLSCPHCGEVHAIVRRDYCQGCGAQRGDDRTIKPAELQAEIDAAANAGEAVSLVDEISGQEDGVPQGVSSVNDLYVHGNSGHRPSASQPPHLFLVPRSSPAPADRWTDVLGGRP